jgi:hypothetical protein
MYFCLRHFDWRKRFLFRPKPENFKNERSVFATYLSRYWRGWSNCILSLGLSGPRTKLHDAVKPAPSFFILNHAFSYINITILKMLCRAHFYRLS